MAKKSNNVEVIYNAAVKKKSGTERSAYLAAACGDDNVLRARVETLLNAREQVGDYLEAPAVDSNVTLDDSPLLDGPGTKIGRYELLEQIGEGGMGLVYMAQQKKPVKRKVALKIIKPGMDSKQVIARFEAERQALAVLDHPNIAHVFDAGTTKTGRPYFIMEYVKGMSITRYCDENKLGIEQRLRLFEQVCEGIHHAHQKGIIHRDIKPSNILVSVHGDRAVPKIIDFGIAKAVTQPLTEKTFVTFQGQLLGTPEYMSPEQVDMATQDIDTRSDIYSLGVVLYELLAGVLPFDREAFASLGFAEVQRTIREQEPDSPSIRLTNLGVKGKIIAASRDTHVVALARRLHRELEWIPLKAMRKDRCRRYRSASEMADDVRNYLNGLPLIAGPETAVYRMQKFVHKHAGSVVMAALVAVAIILGLIVSTAMYMRSEKALEREAIARVQAEDARVQAEEAKDKETTARTRAEQAEKVAQQQHKLAKEQAEAYRRSVYINQIALAEGAYNQNNIKLVRDLLLSCPVDLRNWEWYRVWRIANQARMTLRGHDYSVMSATFSPDGKKIVSGSLDDTIKVWDAVSGDEVMTLKGHKDWVWPTVFSPDGKQIVSGSGDKTIKIWDADSGTEIMTMTGHDGEISSVAFSPNGKWIVSASYDKTIKIWNAASGAEVMTLRGHDSIVNSVAFSPDGKQIVSAGSFGEIKIWDANSGTETMTLRGHNGIVISIAFNPNGKSIVSSSEDNTIKIWDVATGAEINTLTGHNGSVYSVAFSQDGKRIISGSGDNTIKMWDADSGDEIMKLSGHDNRVWSIAFSPDGNSIISGSGDKTIKIWDVTMSMELLTLTGHEGVVSQTAFSPDGKRIVSGSGDKTIKVWNSGSGAEIMTISAHDDRINSTVFSPDGKWIASGSDDNTIKVWNAATGDEVITLREHEGGVKSVAFSPDSKRIASTCGKQTTKVWDAVTGAKIVDLGELSRQMQSVAFSPDGKSIATGGVWGRIRIWDSDSGTELIKIRRHMVAINSIAFSADGMYMVSACADETIKVWNVTSGRELLTLRGHSNHVNSAAFSPDGTRIVSSSDDETIKIWDANSGAEVMTLHGHEGGVASVSFSMDSKRIVSGGYDNTIRIWDIANPEEVASQMPKLGKHRDSLTGKMIAWWKLDETEGNNAADSSGNNLNGKLIGDPQWQFGQVGGALMFDGDGDYVDCGNDSAFNITGSITVAAWIKVNKFDKIWQAICTKGDGAWILHRNADTDNIKFNIFDWGSPDVVGFVNVNDGQWHHVVGAYDGVKIYLYVDGILDSSTPVSTWDEMIINEEPVCIGQNSKYPERSWNGLIDDVRIYSYALSAEEIKDLYEGREPHREK